MRGILFLGAAVLLSGCVSYPSLISAPPDATFTVAGLRSDVADCVHAHLTRDNQFSLAFTLTKDRRETHVFANIKGVIYGGTSDPLLDITFTQTSPTQTRVDYRGRKSLWGSSYMLKEATPYIQQCADGG